MRRARQSKNAVCVLLLFFSICCTALSRTRDTRELLEIGNHGETIVVNTEAELQEAFSRLDDQQTILLGMDELNLTAPLVFDVGHVTLAGRRAHPTTIHCPQNNKESAVIIRATHTSISSVEFHHCSTSAIVVKAKRGDARDELSVTFDRVHFSNNGQDGQQVLGAAIRAHECQKPPCPKTILRFTRCHFFQNRALRGGAIFAEDADLVIRESVFKNNEADLSGGAIYAVNKLTGFLKMKDSQFLANKAHGTTMDTHTSEIGLSPKMHNASFITPGQGGAVFAFSLASIDIHRTIFRENHACQGGGGLNILHQETLPSNNLTLAFNITNSIFERNIAYCDSRSVLMVPSLVGRDYRAGGAMTYEELDETPVSWTIQNTSFVGNRAKIGGAAHFRSIPTSAVQHSIRHCRFIENVALRSGAGLCLIAGRFKIVASTFTNNRAIYGGGIQSSGRTVLSILPDPDDSDSTTVIEGSTAYYGGGMLITQGGSLDLCGVVVRNNTAYRSGGGFSIENPASQTAFRGVVIENNQALLGGGLELISLSNLSLTSYGSNPAIIRNNTAAVGGGIHYMAGRFTFFVMNITQVYFIGNRALHADSPVITRLVKEGNEYLPEPTEHSEIPDVTEQIGEFSLLRFLTETEAGDGGGLHLGLLDIALFEIVEIMFQDMYMAENEAAVGGGMSVHMKDLYWNKSNKTTCFPAIFGIDVCQRFLFHNVTIERNRADYAGGIFSTIPNGIAVSCGYENLTRVGYQELIQQKDETRPLRPYCSDIYRNEFLDERTAEGANAGTRAMYLSVEGHDGPMKKVASGDRLVLPCLDSKNESCSREIRIAVKDAFNQTIVRGIEDANLELALISDSITGDLRYTAVDGIAVINNTNAWGINISSTIKIVSERDRNVMVQIDFSTRGCYPGEIDHGHVCRVCPPDQYGFIHSLQKCEACESNARCTGGAALLPDDGYWHSTPFSPVLRQCIHKRACAYQGRESKLDAYYNDELKLSEDLARLDAYIEEGEALPSFPDYNQCKEGYGGLLCGSCQSGYGHSFTGECVKCPDSGTTNGLLLFLSSVWQFLLIGVNCAITLSSMRSRVLLVEHERTSAKSGYSFIRATHSNRSTLSRTHSRSSGIALMNSDGRFDGQSSGVDTVEQTTHLQLLVTTTQLAETFKILINYLQVTGVSLRLRTEWSDLLRALLEFQSFSSGVSNTVVSVPYECSVQEGEMPTSVSAFWMRLCTPWTVLGALLLLLLILWSVRDIYQYRKKTDRSSYRFNRQRFVTCVIVICIVWMYVVFLDFVRENLRGVNCVGIEERVSPDHPYAKYSIEPVNEQFWAEDTQMTCFQGKHLPVGVVGVIGLVFCLFIIAAIIFWLPLNKKNMQKPEFISRYWFVYQAYREEWYSVPWESIVLTRKALIATVISVSVHLSVSLQAATCAGILTTAAVLQTVFWPFKIPEDHEYIPKYAGWFFRQLHRPDLAESWIDANNSINLNILESISLTSSITMFYSVIISNDATTTPAGRWFVIVLTFVLNVAFLLYMFFRLYSGLHVLFDLRLALEKPSFLEKHKNNTGVLHLVRKGWVVFAQMTNTYIIHHGTQKHITPLESTTETAKGDRSVEI